MEKPASLHPFSLFGKNISDSFWGKATFWHLGAFASTGVMVKTPMDRDIQDYFIRKNPLGQKFAFAMLRLGDATSIVLALSFWGIGHWQDIPTLAAAGAAATQAVCINAVYVQSLKVITGRTRPGEHNSADDFFPSLQERIDNFRFRQSWPSGHTSSAFSFVASQHAFFPEKKWIPFVGYPVAAAIGIGMVEGDYHWASEVLAGAIIGTIIGYTVGGNFRAEFERRKSGIKEDPVAKDKERFARFTVAPGVAGGRYTLAATWYW